MRSRKERPKLVPARTRWSIRETAVLSCAFSTWVLVTWGRGDNKSPWSEKRGVTERWGECKWSPSMVALGLTILTPKGVESKNSNCCGERAECLKVMVFLVSTTVYMWRFRLYAWIWIDDIWIWCVFALFQQFGWHSDDNRVKWSYFVGQHVNLMVEAEFLDVFRILNSFWAKTAGRTAFGLKLSIDRNFRSRNRRVNTWWNHQKRDETFLGLVCGSSRTWRDSEISDLLVDLLCVCRSCFVVCCFGVWEIPIYERKKTCIFSQKPELTTIANSQRSVSLPFKHLEFPVSFCFWWFWLTLFGCFSLVVHFEALQENALPRTKKPNVQFF